MTWFKIVTFVPTENLYKDVDWGRIHNVGAWEKNIVYSKICVPTMLLKFKTSHYFDVSPIFDKNAFDVSVPHPTQPPSYCSHSQYCCSPPLPRLHTHQPLSTYSSPRSKHTHPPNITTYSVVHERICRNKTIVHMWATMHHSSIFHLLESALVKTGNWHNFRATPLRTTSEMYLNICL